MNETVHIFGTDHHLTGIITHAVKKNDPTDPLPAVIFLNAGLLHKVGPYRSSVTLSRQLAKNGFDCFRFDLGGLGDSQMGNKTGSDEERALSDIKDAFDFLQKKKNIKKFVLIGLCSGADYAHPMAVSDARVAGIVLLDGYGYRTPKYYLTHYGPRIFSSKPWKNFLNRLLKIKKNPPPSQKEKEETYVREFAPREKIKSEIESLVKRGSELLYIYTSGVPHYYNYKDQFWDMFSGLQSAGKIQVDYLPKADHTFTFPEDRNEMFQIVSNWLISKHQPSAASLTQRSY